MDEKLILFDWDNVLLNSDSAEYSILNAREDMVNELHPAEPIILMGIFDDKEFWTRSGVDLDLCINRYLAMSGCKCSAEEFKECYLKHYRKVPWYQEMVATVKRLAIDSRFHIGILSTLCEMDYELLKENLPIDIFDYRFFSFNLEVQKPNIRIYKNVEMITGVKPDDILFIDDLKKNIRMAENYGWNTLLATGKDFEKIREKCYSFMGFDYKEERIRSSMLTGYLMSFPD